MEKLQQSTYLTGLYITTNRTTNHNNVSKTPSITNDILISPEYDTYTSLPHPLETRNQIVEFLKYSTYRTNLLKTEFLDYLMKEENFSNIDESEKFVRDNPYKSDVFSLGFCMIIACVLDFNFINKIRNLEQQTKIDKIIRESLEDKYSFKFIRVLLKMIVLHEKDRIDFLGLEKLIKEEL